MGTTKNGGSLRWKNALAGATAGLVPVLALHPLDVIKTRLQVQDGVRGTLPLYRGVSDAMSSMLRQEGWRSLYAGLTPALVGAGVSWGIYFGAYNRAKARYQRRSGSSDGSGKLAPHMHLLAAAEAGALVCCITNPIWVVKTRLELQRAERATSAAMSATTAAADAISQSQSLRQPAARTALPPYRGMVDAVKQIAREEGLAGFYKGLGPSLLLVSHGAIQFMVYEELRAFAAVHRSSANDSEDQHSGLWGRRWRQQEAAADRQPSSAEIVGMGALSKLAASVITYPSQVMRSRLQQRMSRRAIRYRSGWDVLRITLRREGVGGLYKGLLPNVLRVMPQAALTFLVYESIMKQLNARQSKSEDPQNSKDNL